MCPAAGHLLAGWLVTLLDDSDCVPSGRQWSAVENVVEPERQEEARRQGKKPPSTTRLKEAYRDHLLPYEQHLTKDARFTEVPVKYGPILALNPEEGPSSLVGAGGKVSG